MSASASSSAIVVDAVSGYHLLKIDSYSRTSDMLPTGTCTTSCDFRVGNYSWHVKYYPNGADYYTNFVSLRLMFDVGKSLLRHEKARVQFSLLDRAGNPTSEYTCSETANLPSRSFSANMTKGAGWEQWLRLNGDSFTIRFDITLMVAPRATAPADVLDVAAPPSDLHRHMGALLSGEEGADVTFQLAGGESFRAHRCVLAARSSVFRAELLLCAMKEGAAKSVVHVDGVEPQVFGAFLHFVYTDSLPDFSEEEEGETWMAQHLLVVADRYDMERLKLICEEKLCKRIDVSSAATTLALAEQHGYRRLKEACLDFLTLPANLKAVEATDGFEHLATSCPAVLRELIAMLAAL